MLKKCTISWLAKRLSPTSLLIDEVELVAANEAFAQAIHLRALFEDMDTPQFDATITHIDSQAAFQTLMERVSLRELSM